MHLPSSKTLLKVTDLYKHMTQSNHRTPDERYKYDYGDIPLPDQTDKKEYTAAQRRADIYRRIKENIGYIGNVPPTRELAKEYGLSENSHSAIVRDMDEIRIYIVDHDMQQERVQSRINTAMETLTDRAMELAEDAEEPREIRDAVKVMDSFKKWVQESGAIEKEPEKMQHSGVEVSFDLEDESYNQQEEDDGGGGEEH